MPIYTVNIVELMNVVVWSWCRLKLGNYRIDVELRVKRDEGLCLCELCDSLVNVVGLNDDNEI